MMTRHPFQYVGDDGIRSTPLPYEAAHDVLHRPFKDLQHQ